MSKTYSDYMDEITADELYEGLLAQGLFTEKLPPVFTSEEFFGYNPPQTYEEKQDGYGFIFLESMRDINIPRPLGIPNPMAYQRLCACLRDNWEAIKNHFKTKTNGNTHKISRIHIRKQAKSTKIFNMNYKNWMTDDSPVPNILIGKKYMVSADISTCFPSIYTHSLCWALAGKEDAKKNRTSKLWFNSLDHKCMELRSGETHGILIGPHTSNLLSEIILTVVDYALSQNNWEYIRNIDDYTCYVDSYEKAQRFLVELASELRKFDLSLNHKKTKIEDLPVASTKHWVRQLNTFDFSSPYGKMDYKKAQSYLDLAVELMPENNNNAAILNYAIKVLAKQIMTKNARQYCLKTILHYAVIFPYLIPLLDEYVFVPFGARKEDIERFSNTMFKFARTADNYEAITFIIYFSLKYEFDLPELSVKYAKEKSSCLLKCFTWLYYNRRGNTNAIKELRKHAKDLAKDDFDEFWLFIYEVLPKEQLSGDWKPMKKARISFIKKEFLQAPP